MNRQTEIRQTKEYEITPENICIRYIFMYIGLCIQVRVIIILRYLSYVYNKDYSEGLFLPPQLKNPWRMQYVFKSSVYCLAVVCSSVCLAVNH